LLTATERETLGDELGDGEMRVVADSERVCAAGDRDIRGERDPVGLIAFVLEMGEVGVIERETTMECVTACTVVVTDRVTAKLVDETDAVVVSVPFDDCDGVSVVVGV
jgi:hypothetical protein